MGQPWDPGRPVVQWAPPGSPAPVPPPADPRVVAASSAAAVQAVPVVPVPRPPLVETAATAPFAAQQPPAPALPPPAPAGTRPAAGGQRSSRTLVLGAVAATLVTAAAAAGVVLVVQPGATTVGVASAADPTTAEALPATGGGSIPGGATRPTPATSTSTPSRPTYPTTSPGGIDAAAVATDPMTPQVMTVLDTYFGAINAHDGYTAASVFDTSGTVDPSDPAQVAEFDRQISTTYDDLVVVHAISSSGSEHLVQVTFRSQQAAEFGPDGQTCTNWSLTYRLTGAMRLLGSADATYAPC